MYFFVENSLTISANSGIFGLGLGIFERRRITSGVVRRVDELGRIVIPIELRRTMGIEEKDALEIYVDGDKIILKKYEPACIFCGNAEDVTNYKGKNMCKSCMTELAKQIV
jgi:transcriptional pleiotropic regulator of transition state genes